MIFKREKINDVDIIILSGALDSSKSDEMKMYFDEALRNASQKTIIIMETVDYISSDILGLLVSTLKKFKEKRYELIFANIHLNVRYILKITGLDKIFVQFPTLEEALESLQTIENSQTDELENQ